jgi:hypothetical protein
MMPTEAEVCFYLMFPELFRGRFKPEEESLMSHGIDCDMKWFFLLWQHCIELEKTAIVEGWERGSEEWPEIIEIKEKCGSLRCYVRNESEYMRYLREKLLEESEGI